MGFKLDMPTTDYDIGNSINEPADAARVGAEIYEERWDTFSPDRYPQHNEIRSPILESRCLEVNYC